MSTELTESDVEVLEARIEALQYRMKVISDDAITLEAKIREYDWTVYQMRSVLRIIQRIKGYSQ